MTLLRSNLNIKEIIIDSPIYTKWDYNIDNGQNIIPRMSSLTSIIEEFKDRVELYCVKCNERRIFAPDEGVYKDTATVKNIHFKNIPIIGNKECLYKTYMCSFSEDHKYIFGFYVDDEKVIKIAEYPSKYDSIKENFNLYNKIIGDEKVSELAKASQLESFGYAIASFLYYRRIFEYLVILKFKEYKCENKIDEDKYSHLKMKDKIDYIKEDLPEYFTNTSNIYSTIPKHIADCRNGTAIIHPRKLCFNSIPTLRNNTVFYFVFSQLRLAAAMHVNG